MTLERSLRNTLVRVFYRLTKQLHNKRHTVAAKGIVSVEVNSETDSEISRGSPRTIRSVSLENT